MAEVVLQCPVCKETWGCLQYEPGETLDTRFIKGFAKCQERCLIKCMNICTKTKGAKIEQMACEKCYSQFEKLSN